MELTRDETNRAIAGSPAAITVSGETLLIDQYTTATVFAVYEWGLEQARAAWNPVGEIMAAMNGFDHAGRLCELAVAEAAKRKLDGEVPGELVTRCLRSKAGVAFQLFVLTRKHHPGLTYARCCELLTEENRIDVYCDLDRASGANLVTKAVADSGFFPPASTEATIGS